MDISVIQELKEFETEQIAHLEEKKRQLLEELEKKKSEILEKNEMELYELSSGKHKLLKKAEEKAKKKAIDTINSFKEKTNKLELSSANTEKAIELIFEEFRNVQA